MMQPVGEHAALLYATLEDLRERGTTPEALDLEQALPEMLRRGSQVPGGTGAGGPPGAGGLPGPGRGPALCPLPGAPAGVASLPGAGGPAGCRPGPGAPVRGGRGGMVRRAVLPDPSGGGPAGPAPPEQLRQPTGGCRGLGGPGPGGRQRPALRPGPGPAFGRFQGEIGIKTVESGQNTS